MHKVLVQKNNKNVSKMKLKMTKKFMYATKTPLRSARYITNIDAQTKSHCLNHWLH